jgi:hypothetical protein
MLAVNDLGEPCAGEPHARFDGRGLETEHPGQGSEEEQPSGKLFGSHGFAAYRQDLPPRQPPTLCVIVVVSARDARKCLSAGETWACQRSRSHKLKGTP